LNKDRKIYASDIRAEYDAFRETFLNRSRDKDFLTIDKRKIDYTRLGEFYRCETKCTGEQVIEVDVLVPYIDWTPFFRTWNCLENILVF
jgi:5-methyltetrahydrofolate--homocysteine methyltransferase